MYPDQYDHLHQHLRDLEERVFGLEAELQDRLGSIDAALDHLARLEIVTSLKELNTMAKQSEEIGKLGDRFGSLASVVTDIHSDFEALRAVLEAERDNLSPDGQAALDAANAKADALAQQLQDLDVEVGDADGSDIPTGPTEPGDENPPADEGAPFGGPQPTA